MASTKRKKICPECGEPGFLTIRWVRSSRYPKHASLDCMLVEEAENHLAKSPDNEYYQARLRWLRETVRGHRYRDREVKEFIDKQFVYRVSSKKYFHYYVGHYDPKKYQEQMINYGNGKRKSRPNGRKWCKLRYSSYREVYQNGRKYIKVFYGRPLKT